MFCKNCGREILKGQRFCTGCGTPLEGAAPVAEQTPVVPETPVAEETPAAPDSPVVEETPAAAVAPEAPETPVTEEAPAVEETPAPVAVEPTPAPVAVAESEAPVSEEETVPAPKKKGAGKKVAIAVVVLALVGALAAAVAFLLPKVMGMLGGERVPAYVYLTGEGEMMYLPDLKEKTKGLEMLDELDARDYYTAPQFSADGKTVYFLGPWDDDYNADLYCATLAQLKKGEDAERVVKNVQGFQVIGNKYVVYTRYDDGDNVLGLYNGKDDEILTKKASGGYMLSEDEKYIYYAQRSRDEDALNPYTLYRVAVAGGEEELVLEDVSWYKLDGDVLLYNVREDVDEPAGEDDYIYDNDSYTVYSCKIGGEPKKLAEGVYTVFNAQVDGSKVTLDYTIRHTQKLTAYDLVNDPDADEELTEPDPNAYEVFEVYYLDDDGNWYYEDYADETWHLIDLSDLLSDGATAAELDRWIVWDYATETLWQEYQTLQETWELRQELKDWDRTVTTYDLYHYADGDTKLVAADVTDYTGQDGVYVYQKAAAQEKVADMDELTMDNYYEIIVDAVDGGAWYQSVNGAESELELDGYSAVSDVYVTPLSGSEMLMTLYDKEGYHVLVCQVKGGKLTVSEELADQSSGWGLVENDRGEKAVYAIADAEYDQELGASVGTLIRYQNGKREKLCKGVYGARVSQKDGTVYAMVPRDKNNWELVRLQKDKTDTITKKLPPNGAYTVCGGNVLYIDADDNLYAWNGKDDHRVARDVKRIWANTDEQFTWVNN